MTIGSQSTDSGTDGDSVSPGGNTEPEGPSANNEPEVTFKGNENSTSKTSGGSGVASDGSGSISVTGNVDPEGPSGNNNPTLELIGNAETSTWSQHTDQGDGSKVQDVRIWGDDGSDNVQSIKMKIVPNTTGEITKVEPYIGNIFYEGDGPSPVELYIADGPMDSNNTSGTKVASGFATYDSNDVDTWYTIPLDTTYSVTAGNTYHLTFHTPNSDNDGRREIAKVSANDDSTEVWIRQNSGFGWNDSKYWTACRMYIESGPANVTADADSSTASASYGDFSDGETKTKEFDVTTSDSSINFSSNGAGTLDYTLYYDEILATEDPRVDVTGDGNSDAGYNGVLTSGESATVELSALLETTETVDTWTAITGPSPDWDITYTPRLIINWYDGSAFQEGDIYYYDGSAWQHAQNIQRYDGSAWNQTS